MDGRIIYTHEFNNANNIETVYMTRASLPVRYEVISDASATTSSSLVQICSTVISEGGYEPFGSIRSASNDITVRTVAATAFLPLIAIRLRSAYNKASLVPLNADILTQSGSAIFQIRMRAQVTGGTWVQVSDAVEVNTTATAISTDGIIVSEGYVSNLSRASATDLSNTSVTNSSDIGGTADVIIVCAKSFSGSINMAATLQWREIY